MCPVAGTTPRSTSGILQCVTAVSAGETLFLTKCIIFVQAIAMQVATYPLHSARGKGSLSKAAIVAAARIGDELGLMHGLTLAREAVDLDPTEGDHRQV